MLIKEIFRELPRAEFRCGEEVAAGRPVFDSRKVEKGDVFFALKGATDGSKYARDAVKQGASLVVGENDFDGIPHIKVDSVRRVFALYCAAYYGHPERRVKVIGVTGTNGKTSTTRILTHILEKNNFKTALIGTLGAIIDGEKIDTGLTTPDADEFYRLLAAAVSCGTDYVVAEVSAHAIFYEKIYGIDFDYCVFGNLSRDHLDFFGTMENYGEVKKSIFMNGQVKTAIVNADDSLGAEIIKVRKGRTLTYGLYNPSDVFAVDESYIDGIRFVVNAFDRIAWCAVPLAGEFNLYNTLAALAVAADAGVDIESAAEVLPSLPEIPGRFNVLRKNGITVIIDYAHTPDGLQKVLRTARGITKNNLICVFGCGGNRDKQKRPIMGEIAQRCADLCVITSDNPRFEEPQAIISDILSGAEREGKAHIGIADRERAIAFALTVASKGDTVLVAGKGAEEYMDVKGVKTPFSDREACEKYLERKN